MDCSSMTPKTCVLKVNLHGPACEKKVHKLLRKINGVTFIAINGEYGKVTVSGNIDSCSLVMALEKVGKNAEILWEDSAPINCANQFLQAFESRELEGIDPKQLQQLSEIEGVKQVKVTHSKSVKLKFKDDEKELTQKSNTIDVSSRDFQERTFHRQNKCMDIDDVHGPTSHNGYGHRGTDSSCHQSCHGHATEKESNYHFHGSVVSPRARGVHHEKFNTCGSPTFRRRDCPEAPLALPCDHYGPSGSYSYPRLFSDDYPHGCRLM